MWNKLLKFKNEKRGSAFVLAGLAAFILVVALGMSVDVARAMLVRAKLQTSLDSAGLAGGTKLVAKDPKLLRATAEKYFAANYPEKYMGSRLTDLQVNVNPTSEEVTFAVSATLDTLFMQLINVQHLDINVDNAVKRDLQSLEVALVLDETGSMRPNGKMDAMKNAAKRLVETIYDASSNTEETYFSVVPFVATVNIGNNHKSWLVDRFSFDKMLSYGFSHVCDRNQGYIKNNHELYSQPNASATDNMVTWFTSNITNPGDPTNFYFPGVWKGCVEARGVHGNSNSGANDVWDDTTDTPPNDSAAGKWRPYMTPVCHHASGWNKWGYEWPYSGDYPGPLEEPIWGEDDEEDLGIDGNYADGPNMHCGDSILPLTNDEDKILGKIESLVPWNGGGTMANLGIAWGFRSISPKWVNKWGVGSNLPSTAGPDDVRKILIVLTDGVNQFWPSWKPYDFTAYGQLNNGVMNDATGRIGRGMNNGNALAHQERARNELNRRTAETCENAKAADITIYTITFDVDNLSGDDQAMVKKLFRECASNPNYYFNSPDAETLDAAFAAIAESISQLRLSE